MREGRGQSQFHGLVGQQPQRPALPPSRGCTTCDGDQMGLSFAIQLPRLAHPGSFLQRPEVFLDEALARPLDRRDARGHGLGNLLIRQAFIGFKQYVRPRHFPHGGFAVVNDVQKFLSFSRA